MKTLRSTLNGIEPSKVFDHIDILFILFNFIIFSSIDYEHY